VPRELFKQLLRVALLAVVPLAAFAQDAPPVQDWSPGIETVVVTANRAGPLMWRVTKGDSTLVLIGIVGPVPENLPWNSAGVGDALKGARALLLPPRASVGIVEGLWFLTWHSDAIYLPSETPMESTLPPALRQRFVAIREKLQRDADRYARLRVPLAGLRLEGDFLKANKLTSGEPADTVEHMARHLDVPTDPVASYEALPMVRQLPKLSAAANEACMKAALDDIDAIGAHAAAAAEAWAVGDLKGIEANYSEDRFESCVQSMPSFAALFARAVNDSVNTATTALARPGKTVMLVSIGTLLRKDGILDRLKALGLTVEAPGR